MTTLSLYAPADNSTLRIAPETADQVVGLPRIDSPERAYAWGHAHGREGIDLWTGDLDLDLVDWARDGYRAGQDERAAAALLESAPTDAEIAEGTAPWAVLPDPAELAEGLRGLASGLAGDGPAIEFARRALASLAGDVEVFAARTFAELQARDFEMAATAFTCRECGGGAP